VDGGYALEYSPLLEYREGRGLVLFCQMDVTARTESDPAAETLADNILSYVDSWRPTPRRNAIYAGKPSGLAWLKACGVAATSFKGETLTADQVLVIGPGAGGELNAHAPDVAAWIKGGGHVLALGLNQDEANLFLPQVTMGRAEHIAIWFPPFSARSLLAGVAPADVHNRDPQTLPLLNGGATIYGNGVLAKTGNVVFCQLPPFEMGEAMADPTSEPFNRRRTFVRASFAVSRLLANLGVSGSTPLLERFASPVTNDSSNSRWLEGLYLTRPTEWDDPYRFFRW
jgi:beta-galactosidase